MTPAANALAWTVALVTDWFGLARAREETLDISAYRYQVVAGGFVVLAMLPPDKVRWPRAGAWRPQLAVAVATLLVGAAMGVAVSDDLRRLDEFHRRYGTIAEVNLAVATLDSAAVPDDHAYDLNMGYLEARQLRRLIDTFGGAGSASGDEIDREIVERLGIRPLETGFAARRGCRPARPVLSFEARPELGVFVSATSREGPTRVAVRRFGDEWVEVGTIPPGQIYRLSLPDLASPVPWKIRGQGLCRVRQS